VYGEKRNAYRLLVGKPEGKKPLGRPGCRWVNIIKIDNGETGSVQDRDKWKAVVNVVMNHRVP
jgi:hypothetical protein